jgi:uncharacterized protein (DUF1697 family)
MTRYVLLLRAVNVSGKNRLTMPVLRASLEGLDCTDVVTYIQSGNAVFDSTDKPAVLAKRIEEALEVELGSSVDVVLRSARELDKAIAANPYVGRGADRTKLHVLFLDRKPDLARLRTIDLAKFAPEQFEAGEREIYLHLPNGVGRSKLSLALGPKLTPAVATMRNWNTVTKLAELAAR